MELIDESISQTRRRFIDLLFCSTKYLDPSQINTVGIAEDRQTIEQDASKCISKYCNNHQLLPFYTIPSMKKTMITCF